MKILLNEVEKVKQFISTTKKYSDDIDVISGRFVIDGKSILGLFSLDLSKPIEIRINSDNEETTQRFKMEMENFNID